MAGLQVYDRVAEWKVTVYGTSTLSLTPDGAAAVETGISMAMAAVGTSGERVGSRTTGGFALVIKAAALWVGAAAQLVVGAAGRGHASEAGVARLRTLRVRSRRSLWRANGDPPKKGKIFFLFTYQHLSKTDRSKTSARRPVERRALVTLPQQGGSESARRDS